MSVSISRGVVTFLTSLWHSHHTDPPLHSTSDLMSTSDTLHRILSFHVHDLCSMDTRLICHVLGSPSHRQAKALNALDTNTVIACSETTDIRIHWHYYCVLWRYCYTDTLYTSSGTRLHQSTGYPHFIRWYHRYMDARYSVMPCLHITAPLDTSIACSWSTVIYIHQYTCMACVYILVI